MCVQAFFFRKSLNLSGRQSVNAKTAKSTVIPTLGVLTVKSISHYKYLVMLLYIELSDDKEIQRQLRYQYYPLMRASLSDVGRS